ncbi:hypothetical protein DFP72DRAFT_1076637 [Ephemerocybe angulata]|uniref:MYND-type domain-containing protein n=1 Tax=Ephemerocybe angulata TaxID=980116 RepID=A0A8H6HFG2_9AGAR|nr:hypothetical protein DFP72DRAFT_1076637 [Tulosesus angulatus]
MGLEARNDPHTGIQFTSILRDYWPSIIQWLDFALNYGLIALPASQLNAVIGNITNFLSSLTIPPFSPIEMMGDDFEGAVDLALRVWAGEFHRGEAMPYEHFYSLVFFFCRNLCEKDTAAMFVGALQAPTRASSFFETCAAQITAYRNTLSASDNSTKVAQSLANVCNWHTRLLALISDNWDGAWRWVIKHKALLEHAKALQTLVASPTATSHWALTQIGLLVGKADCRPEHLLGKLLHLARGDIIPALYGCLKAHDERSAEFATAQSLLKVLSAYLPYQAFAQAVSLSLSSYFSGSPIVPLGRCSHGWKVFVYLLARYYPVVATERRAYFAFACDNLNHLSCQNLHPGSSPSPTARRSCSGCRTVFYCSRECQREDWESLHRSECRSAATEREARRQGKQWFAWGSRGDLARAVLEFSNNSAELAQEKKWDNELSIVSWEKGMPTLVTPKRKKDCSRSSAHRQPHYVYPRLQALMRLPGNSSTRIIEGSFNHGTESIHVTARLLRRKKGDYVYLHGVAMIR